MSSLDTLITDMLKDTVYGRSDVGAQIKELRTSMGLDQEQFGSLMSMKQSAVARLESDVHFPSIRTLKRIADRCDAKLVLRFER